MHKPIDKSKILIVGITNEGKPFRPVDWAYRMSDRLATFKEQRIKYSPLLQPTENEDGYKCIIIDIELKKTNPSLYNSIMAFAKSNNLKICKIDD